MQKADIKIIKETFQEIADLVTPTMGAKGRLAVINQDMEQPLLTDDGVTLAREARNLQGLKRTVALAMIEGAHNTEKEAYDGTTLTILLTNELYKLGLKWKMHPQQAADKILELVEEVRQELRDNFRQKIEDKDVYSIAKISTKIDLIGEIVHKAYLKAGDQMNVLIQHDRNASKTYIDHNEGMVMPSGYMTEILAKFCNKGNDETEFDKAHIAMFSSGRITSPEIREFFKSIPEEKHKEPFVFILPKGMNPESMSILIDTLVKNKFTFQFIFINEEYPDEIYGDLAAKADGKIQDVSEGSSNYLFEHCGMVDKIIIGRDSTVILQENNERVQKRIDRYKKILKDDFYLQENRKVTIRRRMSSLETGIVKIMVGVPTITEFGTIKNKLDDAIGAVKCAIQSGKVAGGGVPLHYIGRRSPLKKALQKPAKQIMSNAGLKFKDSYFSDKGGIDVLTGKNVYMMNHGIIDSYDSIDTSLKNAASIAANFLRAFIVIKR